MRIFIKGHQIFENGPLVAHEPQFAHHWYIQIVLTTILGSRQFFFIRAHQLNQSKNKS